MVKHRPLMYKNVKKTFEILCSEIIFNGPVQFKPSKTKGWIMNCLHWVIEMSLKCFRYFLIKDIFIYGGKSILGTPFDW